MSVRKKMIFVIACLMGGGSLSSASVPHGIYVGFGGNYNKTKGTLKDISAQEVGAGNVFMISGQRQDLNALGITGFLGYLHVFPQYSLTLGGEAFWTFYKGERTFQNSQVDPTGNNLSFNINSKLSQQYEYGFKVLLGYLINESNHIYTLMGISYKNFKVVNELKALETAVQYANQSLTSTFNNTYFLIGAGYERGEGPIRYGIEGFYQFGKKTNTINNTFHFSAAGSDPTAKSPMEVRNSFTVLLKVSYNFNVFK